MSRIDEALRRAQRDAKNDPGGETPAERTFTPAWSDLSPSRPAADALPRERVSISSDWVKRLAAGPGGDPALIEQFTRLAATLHQARQTQPLRCIMMTSATPGDGKTFTACNLAYVLAETYKYRVLLVDADLRRPSISAMVNLPEGVGLSEALRASTPKKLALTALTPRLTFLPAGRPVSNSIEALVSPRMKVILEEAVANFDWIVVDAPPVAPTSDARLLSQMVDGTLFVIRAGKTQHPDAVKSIEMIGRQHILGIVLNDVAKAATDKYYYVGYETKPDRA